MFEPELNLSADLRRLVADQCGVVTRRQLRIHGVSPSTIRWAIGRRWQLLLAGVVATFQAQPTEEQRLRAGALYAGRAAVLSGPTAARLHGVTSSWVDAYPLLTYLVPPERTDRSSGFAVVRRSKRPENAARTMFGVAVASAPRAVADAVRMCRSEEDAKALAISAEQRGIVTENTLFAEMLAGPVRNSAALRQAIRDTQAGAWSIREVELLQVLSASPVLPPVMANPALRASDGKRLPTPDAWIDDVGLAIQLHSHKYHVRDHDWDSTVMGDRDLSAVGITVIGVTPNQLRLDPGGFQRLVEDSYLALRRRGGRPDVTAVDRYHLEIS